jgi:oligopeptide/dipeptide ABC transporter ATP-binding protein
MSEPELLQVEQLRVRMPGPRGPVTIVDGVDLVVRRGEILGIAGESGSGKTMTVLSLVGLHPESAVVTGHADFEGRDLLSLGQSALRHVRGRNIGIVFQDPMTTLHPMLTIERQLTEHMRRHLGVGRREARRRAIGLLEEVRIPDAARAIDGYPHHFSGGMRQRIVIAMALACEPKLLIADEPTTALDVTVQAGILALIDQLCRDRGMAVLLVTHDLGVMSSIAGRLSIFYAGRIVEAGPVRDLLQLPQHPYTKELLMALPDPKNGDEPLTPIPGSPATPGDRPSGCAFHPRCRWAIPSCSTTFPPLKPVGSGRESACPVAPFAHGFSQLHGAPSEKDPRSARQ